MKKTELDTFKALRRITRREAEKITHDTIFKNNNFEDPLLDRMNLALHNTGWQWVEHAEDQFGHIRDLVEVDNFND